MLHALPHFFLHETDGDPCSFPPRVLAVVRFLLHSKPILQSSYFLASFLDSYLCTFMRLHCPVTWGISSSSRFVKLLILILVENCLLQSIRFATHNHRTYGTSDSEVSIITTIFGRTVRTPYRVVRPEALSNTFTANRCFPFYSQGCLSIHS